MIFIYRTGIFFYSILVRIFALFNEKARLFIGGRKYWEKHLALKRKKGDRYIWIHCASLGEFEQGRPVIEAIKKQIPEYKIALTFFSPSGFEIRKNYELADLVGYLPIDTKRNAKKFLEILQPEKAIFVKYEFWYFFISELNRRMTPVYVISAIFRENQYFFKNTVWGKWYRKLLFSFSHIFVQNEKSAQLLSSIGLTNYTISGDTRFDRVATIAENSKKLPIVEKFKGNSRLIIAGSTWKADEDLLSKYINNYSAAKMIIVPHEVSEANINRLKKVLKKPAVLFSQIDETSVEEFQIMIVDIVGILSSLYSYGKLAYIGGGFGVGIHNILEAATFGLPVIFGPNHQKFKEALDLKSAGGAFSISDYSQLETTMNSLLKNKNKLNSASEICKNYIVKNVGSTQLIIKHVFKN